MRAVCVYCGSNPGSDPVYLDAARALGRTIAEAGLGVVYGGARVHRVHDDQLGQARVRQLAVAQRPRQDAHHGAAGGERGVGHRAHQAHERKAMMAERADAFVALPGGLGTLEELFEVLTWAQLGIHAKPCGVLDVAGYWAPLLRFLDRSVEQGFMTQLSRDLLLAAEDPATLLDRFRAFEPAPRRQWLTATET